MNRRLNDEGFQHHMRPIPMERGWSKQYKCLIENYKGQQQVGFIYAYNIREAVETLSKMQNVARILVVREEE
ncbi:hypothetical protein QOFMPA_00093 [Enterococcus phage vB_OCPT_Toy]|nr:hypothetical protein QOFMPA_00093 [Enterococcus phage vB_OCPT_Toy]